MKKKSLISLLIFMMAVTAVGAANDRFAKLGFKPCQPAGVEGEALCGTYPVLENRELKKGRKIDLNIVVLPAQNPEPAEDPLFILQGGPGQAATKLAEFYETTFAEVRLNRDIILVDQRGTGKSNGLNCNLLRKDAGLQATLDELFPIDGVRNCHTLLEQRADLNLYTTTVAMQDLDELREWLGYDWINIYGTSYGTSAAFVYLRNYPEHVRAIVMKGLVPPTMNPSISTAVDSQRALDATLADCAVDSACHAAFPELNREYVEILERLKSGPVEVTATDPVTHQPVKLQFSRQAFALTLRMLLHSPVSAAQIPALLHRAHEGNWLPLAQVLFKLRPMLDEELSLGMFLTIYCSEEIPFVNPSTVEKETAGTFTGDLWYRPIADACQVWPKAQIPANFHVPFRSEKPVLLISGKLDPVTPDRWGAEAAKNLPNSRQVIVKKGSHSFNQMSGCVEKLIAAFIQDGSGFNLDDSCTNKIQRPPFVVGQ